MSKSNFVSLPASLRRVFSVALGALSLGVIASASLVAAPLQQSSHDVSSVASAAPLSDGVPMAPAEAPPERPKQDKSSDQGFTTEDFLKPDSPTAPKRSTAVPEKMTVRVEIAVPQLTDAVDKFVAYPYAMPIPKRRGKPYYQMPASKKAVRDLILSTGYATRNTESRYYPQGGWRWKMAYRDALKKSGMDEPHVIMELYPFVHRLEPYVLAECKKWDQIEEARTQRVQRVTEEYELNRADAENEATRKGYYPVEFRFLRGVRSRGGNTAANLRLPEGTWYLTGTHRVPGLTYYWQEPVQVSEGIVQTVELNMTNALLIEGGW